MLASILIIGGTSVGAFVLSFNTPTVGLGCRTGGYLIFFVVALVLLIAEIVVWWLTSPLRKQDQFQSHLEEYTRHATSHRRTVFAALPELASTKTVLTRSLDLFEQAVLKVALLPYRLLPGKSRWQRLDATEAAIRAHFIVLRRLSVRGWLQRAFFTPLEFANLVWACYLLAAQTVGAFNNCACMTSNWGGFGGYLDFTQINATNSAVVEEYWIIGTIISCVMMGLGMSYIVLEVRFLFSTTASIFLQLTIHRSGFCKHTSVQRTTKTP